MQAGSAGDHTRSVGQITYEIQLLEKRNRMLQLMAKVRICCSEVNQILTVPQDPTKFVVDGEEEPKMDDVNKKFDDTLEKVVDAQKKYKA